MPVPDKFSGTRADLFEFISQLNLKLVANKDRLFNEQAKLMYTCNLLSSNASRQLRPYIKADDIKITNMATFIKILEAWFGDPDKVVAAEREVDA